MHESIQEDCTTTLLALPCLLRDAYLMFVWCVWRVLSVNLMSGHFVFSFHYIPQRLFLCISCWWQSSHYCERLRFDRTDCVKAGLKAFSPAKGWVNIYVYLCVHYNNKWSLFVNNPMADVGLQRKHQPFQITPCWKKKKTWMKQKKRQRHIGPIIRALYLTYSSIQLHLSCCCQLLLIDRLLVKGTMLVSLKALSFC